MHTAVNYFVNYSKGLTPTNCSHIQINNFKQVTPSSTSEPGKARALTTGVHSQDLKPHPGISATSISIQNEAFSRCYSRRCRGRHQRHTDTEWASLVHPAANEVFTRVRPSSIDVYCPRLVANKSQTGGSP